MTSRVIVVFLKETGKGEFRDRSYHWTSAQKSFDKEDLWGICGEKKDSCPQFISLE
jgi:hypothetical protein